MMFGGMDGCRDGSMDVGVGVDGRLRPCGLDSGGFVFLLGSLGMWRRIRNGFHRAVRCARVCVCFGVARISPPRPVCMPLDTFFT